MACCAVTSVRAADLPLDRADADAALLDAWWDVVELIEADAPWADCRSALDEAIQRYPQSTHAEACRSLRDGIVLAEMAGDDVPEVTIDADVATLAAALPAARVSIGWVLMPLQYYSAAEQTVWAFYADRAIVGAKSAALLLHRQGRSAIPALIERLDDPTATRNVSPDRSQLTTPVALRVGDVALGLIEAISLCRFRDPPVSFHQAGAQPLVLKEWPANERAALIASIRAWWNATKDLPPEKAVLWRIRQASRAQQLEMLDVLIATGQAETALVFLYGAYRDGPTLDERLAERMLRAGSRAPLDFLHQAVRTGRPADHTMISLIAEHGDVQDFQLLRDLVVDGAVEGGALPVEVDLPMLVNVLSYADSRQCLPVLVAVLEKHQAALARSADADRVQAPAYIGRAAERIETICGVDFGFDAREAPQRRQRAIEDILDWWNREGRGAYGYAVTGPHAPAGIR